MRFLLIASNLSLLLDHPRVISSLTRYQECYIYSFQVLETTYLASLMANSVVSDT